MGKPDPAAMTAEAYRSEIARLEEQLRLLEDPAQRARRQDRRALLLGKAVIGGVRMPDALVEACRAGEEGWLFAAGLLESDGWTHDQQAGVWRAGARTLQ